MKKRLLIFLLIIMLFSLTSCVKNGQNGEDNTNNKKTSTPIAVCTSKEDLNEIKMETKTTITFNENNYATGQKVETIQTYGNKDLYNIYADNIKQNADAAKDSEFFEYIYTFDEKKLQISTTIVYKDINFDFSAINEEEKAALLASNIIKEVENAGEKCEISGATRKELGL